MNKHLFKLLAAGALLSLFYLTAHADTSPKTLVITMTNDPDSNAIVVFDAATHSRVQTLSTNGKGGVGNNARGVAQYNGRIFAAVNYKSGTVAIFNRAGDRLVFHQLITTTSSPVSLDFANGHMYVAGLTRADSFLVHGTDIGALDGTTELALADGGIPAEGNTSQVGALDPQNLIVTLKTDPTPGTVDVLTLRNGAISGAAHAVSAPGGTLAPFGFSVYPDGTALVTLAHSGHDGLFRNGGFTDVVVSGGQLGNCWTTRVGKYVFIVNTGSRTISRAVGTGSNIFIDVAVAATIATGGSPTDADAIDGYLGVIDHTGGAGATSHLTIFTYNAFGELSSIGNSLDLGVRDANGVAVMPAIDGSESD